MAQNRETRLLPHGTTVLELGESIATSVCGRFLHRMGAEVIRVMPRGATSEVDNLGPEIGDGAQMRSALSAWLRDGKTQVEFALETSAGRQELGALIRTVDVVLIAGTTAEWRERGIILEHLHSLAPRAVIGQITPCGDSGPYSGLRGGELVAQARGGLLNLVGNADREPVRLGGNPMQATAGLLALDGVLIGLFNREQTGEGSSFDLSEFESVAHVEWKIASAVQAGRPRERRGDEGGGPVVVKANDGHFGFFFIPKNWADVKRMVGDARLDDEKFSTPKLRAEHMDEYTQIVEDTTRELSKKDLYHRAQKLGIPAGYVATMTDLIQSPQYEARQFFQPVNVEGVGTGLIPDVPWQILSPDDLEPEGIAS
jgi:crotonobetainyl-CoA:carnitine CoA-transferase CaiB-like acyl-CoA transferase